MQEEGEAPQNTAVFRVFLAVALVTVFVRALLFTVEPLAWVGVADNDDIMRLLSVRGWLAGQGWFDMYQYRMMPPNGVDMHWSRYIDAAIAGLLVLFSLVLPAPQAENIALVAWPTLLFGLLVALTAITARRTLGTSAAMFALVSVMLWPPISHNFLPYRIDHHNVQILLISVVVFSLILPGRPMLLGLAGGLAGAISFAVGIEMLIAIGLAGVVLVFRAVVSGPPATMQLFGFAVSLFAGNVVLFLGQTTHSMWSVGRCDQLSSPYLALTAGGAAVAVVIAYAGLCLVAARRRMLILVAVSAVALVALFPFFGPCLKGPFDELPLELQALILTRISEARGLVEALGSADGTTVRLLVPALFSTLLALGAVARRLAHGRTSEIEVRTVGVLLLFALTGLLGSIHQVRMIFLAAPAIPLLTGYCLASLIAARKGAGRRSVLISLAAVLAMFGTLFLPTVDAALRQARVFEAKTIASADCRRPEVLVSLSAINTGAILSHGNLAAPILLLTPHSVLSGPYHRSPEAFMNTLLPFERDETFLRNTLANSGADYLLLCRGQNYVSGTSFAERLDSGERVDWLKEVPGLDPALLVFRIRADTH